MNFWKKYDIKTQIFYGTEFLNIYLNIKRKIKWKYSINLKNKVIIKKGKKYLKKIIFFNDIILNLKNLNYMFIFKFFKFNYFLKNKFIFQKIIKFKKFKLNLNNYNIDLKWKDLILKKLRFKDKNYFYWYYINYKNNKKYNLIKIFKDINYFIDFKGNILWYTNFLYKNNYIKKKKNSI